MSSVQPTTSHMPHDMFSLARAFSPDETTESAGARIGNEGSLLQLRGMDAASMRRILQRAREFLPAVLDPAQRSAVPNDDFACMTVALMFFEHSTRTNSSFAIATARLGAAHINFSAANSSMNKGETVVDTARTIRSMGADTLVVRTPHVGAVHLIAARTGAPILNAGDGTHEHPTQGLLDALALANALDIDDSFDFAGKYVLIVGDIAHSRVARSNAHALTTLGAHVVLCGPESMAPDSLRELVPTKVDVTHDMDAALADVDAVMMLRVQFERHIGACTADSQHEPATRNAFTAHYTKHFSLTTQRADKLKPDALVMHPGPFNRGLEIASSVVDGKRSIIWHQVSCGIAVRMAVLERALAGG